MQAAANGLIDRAVRLLRADRPAEAKSLLADACRSGQSGDAEWFLYGAALHRLDELEAALRAFSEAARLAPGNPQAWSAKAAVLLDLKLPDAALEASHAALALSPNDPGLIFNASRVLESMGRFDAALAGYENALAHQPDFLPALLNRGLLLACFQRLDAAHDAVQAALAHHPDQPECWYLLGDILFALQRPQEALSSFERATALQPAHLPAHMGKALALSALGRFDEAYAALRHVQGRDANFYASYKSPLPADYVEPSLARDPRRIYCAMQFQRLERCDWSEREAFRDNVRMLVEHPEGFPGPLEDWSLPHPVLALDLEPDLRLNLARQVAAGVKAEASGVVEAFRPASRAAANRRLRIGYVSPDFRRHATAFLSRQLFEAHDRGRFEVLAYALQPGDGSAVEASIRGGCDCYRQMAGVDSASLARRIRDDQVDILVDLAGYTRHARPEIFAARCAPVQVGYLGYPGTLGGAALDYAIVDDVVCPQGGDRFWSESLVRLPGTYAIYDDMTAVSASTARAEHGLPEGATVLCCFNTAWKIDPGIFEVWMRLLRRLPQSVLWLWSVNPFVRDNLSREALRAGVAPERLVFGGPLEHAAHLARYRHADFFLDTLPCNAHTTAADALWMGVPVVTVLGGQMQGRVAASLLRAAGLPELVTASLADYETLAHRLATEPGVLSALRFRLAEGRRTGELFNTRRKVRDLEQAFGMMWQRHCSGLPPTGFAVQRDASA